MQLTRRRALGLPLAFVGLAPGTASSGSGRPAEIGLDVTPCNPVGLVLKAKGLLEAELAPEGIRVRWVRVSGSNMALDLLKAGSIDFGSSAGAAALLGRVSGAPIRAIYAFARPEWTALVKRADSPISSLADLGGKRIAVTRGTDPHVLVMRSLAKAGLSPQDVKLVLLQHEDGRTALERGAVDAWAGLDPMMAAGEVEAGDVLFHRDPGASSCGLLSVREAFAAAHPDLVRRVLASYEVARTWCLAQPDAARRLVAAETGLAEAVVARLLERTDLSDPAVGPRERDTILAAGLALQQAGVVPDATDVAAALGELIDTRFMLSAK